MKKPLEEAVEQHLAESSGSKSKLARDMSMSRTTLYQKLRGESELRLDEAYKLSRELGCTVDELCEIAGISNE